MTGRGLDLADVSQRVRVRICDVESCETTFLIVSGPRKFSCGVDTSAERTEGHVVVELSSTFPLPQHDAACPVSPAQSAQGLRRTSTTLL